MSTFPTPIDEQVEQFTLAVYSSALLTGGASSRDIAIAIEAEQAYIDYLDLLKDNISFDTSVTIEVDGTRIKFKNDDDFSKWLVEQMSK